MNNARRKKLQKIYDQLERLWQRHNEAVATLKIAIYEKEQELSEISKEHTCRKSDIYDCFAASNAH